MSLESLKKKGAELRDRAKLNYHAVDEYGAMIAADQAVKQETRLVWYMKIAGTVLFVGILAAYVRKAYLELLIVLCTLHLHIIINYRFKNMAGVPQWTTQKQKKSGKSSQTG